jgi:hypothetical protein
VKQGSSWNGLKAIAIFAAISICALTPAAASARGTTVPPGATEGDQYFEVAPNGGGSSSVDRDSGGSGGSGAVPATQALNTLGPEGRAAAELANSNRPPEQGGPAKQGKPDQTPNAPPSSSTQGEGGMDFLFPLLLVVTALAAVGYGLRRRLNPT